MSGAGGEGKGLQLFPAGGFCSLPPAGSRKECERGSELEVEVVVVGWLEADVWPRECSEPCLPGPWSMETAGQTCRHS